MQKIRRRDPRSRAAREDADTPGDSEPLRGESAEPRAVEGHPHPALRILPEVAVLGFCALLFWRTMDFRTSGEGPGPAFYPRILIGLLVVAMIVRIIQQLREIRRERITGAGVGASPSIEEGGDTEQVEVSNVRVWQAIALAIGYVVASIYLGWVIATFCFVVVFLYVAGKRALWITAPLAAASALICTYVFVKIVYIPLPTGVGVFDLFTVRVFELIGAY